MFRSGRLDNASTVFVGTDPIGLKKDVSGSAYYYYYHVPTESVYRFDRADGDVEGSAMDFMETADWNKMTRMGSLIDLAPPATEILNSGPPLYLRDLQVPWTPEPRVVRAPSLERRRMVEALSREWCFIPEDRLPSPWSCDWRKWYGWVYGPLLLPEKLRRQYGISKPLSPIMFRQPRLMATVFEAVGTFYLADKLDFLQDNVDHQ
ncbi:hypothetical protein K438DRAFT_379194 [Mycena galopus ATCC 62051]|nr:hypothetical protein K438DRAFT_379194 [Mycena galopus ATCC 62051]